MNMTSRNEFGFQFKICSDTYQIYSITYKCCSTQKIKFELEKIRVRDIEYDISAVILKSGGIFYGHFRIFVKMNNSKWILFDDDEDTATFNKRQITSKINEYQKLGKPYMLLLSQMNLNLDPNVIINNFVEPQNIQKDDNKNEDDNIENDENKQEELPPNLSIPTKSKYAKSKKQKKSTKRKTSKKSENKNQNQRKKEKKINQKKMNVPKKQIFQIILNITY